MRMKMTTWFVLALVTAMVFAREGAAELQNVEIGGEIRILGEYYHNGTPEGDGLRWPAEWLIGRPVGNGPDIFSVFGWNGRGHNLTQVAQWTRLHVKADLTSEVMAYIELDSTEVWGEDFRSNYVTGVDTRANTSDDIEVYQSYIEANALFGAPLRLRIGRQEIRLGSEWLVGANDDATSPVWGLSFDAVRLTYATDLFSVDAWSAKLVENGAAEDDGDVDFYGVYASWLGIENTQLDAYWMLLRDARAIEDVNRPWAGEWTEGLFNVDDYDPTMLHTVGLRAAGDVGSLDFEFEAAYQFGNADSVGSLFYSVLYGDDSAEYDSWGLNAHVGYTWDARWTPRVYVGYDFYEGEDNRDITIWRWASALYNPFHKPVASVSFNRLFSNWSHSAILDGSDISNAHIFHVGLEAAPTDNIAFALDVGYYLADEPFDRPVLPPFTFWTKENSASLGVEVDANITYSYSDDLSFTVGWDHLFVGDGLDEGSFLASNGLDFNGGRGGEDADYLYWETTLKF